MKSIQAQLYNDIKSLIQATRSEVSQRINKSLITMYWHIGKRIQNDILNNKRAQYGEQTIKKLSQKLTIEFGKGWSTKTLHHCLHFVETFPNNETDSSKQMKLLQLDKSNIRIAQYLTQDLPTKLLQKKLKQFYQQSKKLIENH